MGQFQKQIPTLAKLLADADPDVQEAAALSLLSFSLTDNGDVLQANIKHPQYHPLFVNALAREDAGLYLEELAEIVKKQKTPEPFWGGLVPWGVSWELLFFYVQRQPAAEVRGGKFDKVLDALEYPRQRRSQGAELLQLVGAAGLVRPVRAARDDRPGRQIPRTGEEEHHLRHRLLLQDGR